MRDDTQERLLFAIEKSLMRERMSKRKRRSPRVSRQLYWGPHSCVRHRTLKHHRSANHFWECPVCHSQRTRRTRRERLNGQPHVNFWGAHSCVRHRVLKKRVRLYGVSHWRCSKCDEPVKAINRSTPLYWGPHSCVEHRCERLPMPSGGWHCTVYEAARFRQMREHCTDEYIRRQLRKNYDIDLFTPQLLDLYRVRLTGQRLLTQLK